MNPWINYHHLYYFKTIAEEGSISRAAEKLLIGQPTLSAQLKQFEDQLGVSLFERQHKKIILTEQGKLALDYAKNIFRMGSEMYEVLQDRIRPQKTHIHIAALDSIPKQIIMQLVRESLKFSSCQITLSEGKFNELARELSAHRVDLVVTNFLPNGTDARGLYPRLIAKNNVSFFASSKFKNLKKNFPQSISGQPLILPTFDSRLRQDLEHWARLNNLELNIVVESQDISVKKMVAVHEMGIFPAALHSVIESLERNDLIEIGGIQGIHEEVYLLSAQRKIENPIASHLMKNFSVKV